MWFFPISTNTIHRKGHFFRGQDIQNLNESVNTKTHESLRPKYSTQHVFPHHFPSTVDTGSEFSMKLLKEFCEFLSEFVLMGTHHELPGSNLAPSYYIFER